MSHDPMAEIRASFFIECEELLESLQDALLALESGGHSNETINVVFRAVHSIKGGAGAFGLDALVSFAHRFETVLDELRSDRLELTPEAIKLFFQGADVLQDQIRAAQVDGPEPEAAPAVLAALEALIGGVAEEEEEVVDFTPAGLSFAFGSDDDTNAEGGLGDADLDEGIGELPIWSIHFRPDASLYSCGNEALLIIKALQELGEVSARCVIPEELPLVEERAELPSLAWDIELHADCTEKEIREVFDFVADVCDLTIKQTTEAALSSPFPDADALVGVNMSETAAELPPPAVEAEAAKPEESSQPEPPTARPAPSPPAAPSRAPQAPTSEPVATTVRVDLERIDRLVNLVGELVINQAMLAQSVNEAGMAEHPAVVNGLEEFMMLTRDIQDSVMMIRAQPVKPLFQRMSRIVREASNAVGKEVRFRTEGENTEVDKTVIERLADPLTHMIRNAVDHGLETPEKRLEAGKSSEGTITLLASHRAGRIIIEISDDGAGINRPKVREIAIAKGLIPADAILTDTEIDNLLFLPGFSTASQVSALSGRGVGMDVVKSAIGALGGRITISSEPGKGTTFSISLPLTLAVLDGMVVRVADQTLVVPLNSIVETATLTSENIKPIGSSAELLHIRGDFVALHDLGTRLGFRQQKDRLENSIVILTTQDDGSRAALIVDSIMEQRQVVIKGLGQNYGNIPGVAAATILGDGQIALILDPSNLAQPKQLQNELH
ncbi:chemotaxis protein CheA [Paracoccus aminophilus]|uniref:Chemotaxis protein CheA n=1 Tax=Paracoccus aminophilus JCM 7686 TaxID=1367847 RepID=S5XT90_PARAH|nr:chemotaxis protein CheA [Paracoccus aminophilus]AGT08382.1 chemotaxis protein CheA [Paracoccus aminophilus JCM 7686]